MRGRIRSIKPDIGKHEGLWDLGVETGLPVYQAFTMLWCYADREGRFEWRPRSLKTDILPYWEGDFSRVLDALEQAGFVQQYTVAGVNYGYVPAFVKHQVINQREAKSVLPEPSIELHVHARASQNIAPSVRVEVFARDAHKCVRCGISSDLTIDHIFPRSIGGTNAITNLRTLCRPCNSGRPVTGDALVADLAKDNLSMHDMQRMCMHVQTHGEGKGREGKGVGDASATRPAPKAPKPKGSKFVPEDWAPSDGHYELANRLRVNLERELLSFRAHEFKTPKTDFDRAFTGWLTRSAQFGTSSSSMRAPVYEPKPIVWKDGG